MPTPPISDRDLHATVEACRLAGSIAAGARALGLARPTVQHRIREAVARGLCAEGELQDPRYATNAVAVEHPALAATGAAAGFPAGSVSHYWHRTRDESGAGISAFVKVDKEADTLQSIAEALAADLPRLPPIPAPALNDQGRPLCNVYTLTDAHIGMLAWHKEGGADWNIREARRVLSGSFALMVDRAPYADVAVVAVLGDWLHWDGFEAVTPTSRHILDADTRFPKMIEVGSEILRQVVDHALHRHARVLLVCAEGNHDQSSAKWLAVMFRALYENEPRLKVHTSQKPIYAYQHGEVMLGWHHGHQIKPAALPLVMAAEYPEIWGATSKRFFHVGHMHHTAEKEHAGAVVVQHPTLAARDAYAARHGFLAMRRAAAITYHDAHGEVGRVYVSPEMLA